MKIIDEFYLRYNFEKYPSDIKLKSSKNLINYDSINAEEKDLLRHHNNYIKKVLSKNPAFIINYFNIHTINYLFISIFEKPDSSAKISNKEIKSETSKENVYFEYESGDIMNYFNGNKFT